ncbi:MAG: L-serine ammonia-lyase, partial [Calditrichaeota bacterium]|nr:L-serine ammonia-lyase [Calditrichota bacterium]
MISTSIFELFKIGPGPSSSHTVGPMFAAYNFRKNIIEYIEKLSNIHELSVQVELYGSLSDTGIGHGTHRAIVAGLMGDEPTTVNIKRLTQIFENKDDIYEIDYNGVVSPFSFSDIVFVKTENPYRHPNTLKFQLVNNYKIELVSIYYSIGGGFIEKD